MLLGGFFDYDAKKDHLIQIDQILQSPDTWQDREKVQALGKNRAQIESLLHKVDTLASRLFEAKELLNLAYEENDEPTIKEASREIDSIDQLMSDYEFQRLFKGKTDSHSAYLDIQAGSGGTEAQDWAEILLRMYLRWGERRRYKTTLTEVSPGEVAGIKSATVHFEGEYAYGWLRTETGVHRLVRLSPFDSNQRRHTSFAAVFVSPEVQDDIEIEINPSDLRIDTYRASGAGGQHVQKTDSAVRITHLPTRVVVQCQNDRSQHRNRDQAMRQLRAKLHALKQQEQLSEQQALESEKREIGWGSQIRSYVLDDSRIKDLRTQVEVRNTQKTLDGDIDLFLKASLEKDQ